MCLGVCVLFGTYLYKAENVCFGEALGVNILKTHAESSTGPISSGPRMWDSHSSFGFLVLFLFKVIVIFNGE